jgi:hypothetical protein
MILRLDSNMAKPFSMMSAYAGGIVDKIKSWARPVSRQMVTINPAAGSER